MLYVLVHAGLGNELVGVARYSLRGALEPEVVRLFLKQANVAGPVGKLFVVCTFLDQTISLHQWDFLRDQHDTLRRLLPTKLLLVGRDLVEAGSNGIHLTEVPSAIAVGTHAVLLVMMAEGLLLQRCAKLLYYFILVDLVDDFGWLGWLC